MAVIRANVEATKAFIRARLGNPYVYGGSLSAANIRQGTDCSEVWQTVLEMALGRWKQGRQGEGATTESYRYVPVGGVGPFGTIRVARPQDIPADAAARIAFHHGPGGGANSHMWGELDGMRIESAGSKGLVTAPRAMAIDNAYATAWAYLPGPIVGVAAAPDGADVLARATGLSPARALQILPQVREGLTAAECTNPNRIAMWLAQIGHESDSFQATEEYASGDEATDRWKYKGRTWTQITWSTNYLGFSQWCHARGLIPTATYFVDRPRELAEQKWAGLGAAWYWTVARPDINRLSDARDLVAVTKRINGGTNGLPDRQARYSRALTLDNELLALTTTTDPLDPWEALLMSDQPLESISLYATPGEARRFTPAEMLQSVDGMTHRALVERDARLGDPDSLARIVRVARGEGKYRDPAAINHARAVLAEIEAANPEILQAFLQKGQS